MRRLLLISLLAFAAGLAVLTARGDDTPAAPRPERPVLTGTAGRHPEAAARRPRRPRRPSPRARRRLPAAGARDRRPVLLRARRGRPRHAAHARGARHRRRARARAPRLPRRARARPARRERSARRSASTRSSSSAATTTPHASCRRCSTASRTSPATPAPPTCASCAATWRAPSRRCASPSRAGGPAAENGAYVGALLGELERRRGRRAAARRAFEQALALVARPPGRRSRAGAARGRRRRDRRLRALVERLPLPEYVIALGEAELAAGRKAAARDTLALVAAEQQLLDAAGVDTDVELAVFEADHGDPKRAVELARRGWDAAPSTRSADALGWALTRAGDPEAGSALGAPGAEARLGRPALARARRPRGAGGGPPRRGPPAPARGLAARPRRVAVAGTASETRAARLICPSGEHRRTP